ncbi:hypothetical protein NDU88_005012 [Pleurodeles waltl]|uniref:Uncharacterized protein n=1 Tax=Pleurodeles waltl TaxID=8319 RepID=A0AAV7SKK0_PLEWA|nr:hypothetical protein NDU88_005012 [Pleurodeles waltl]
MAVAPAASGAGSFSLRCQSVPNSERRYQLKSARWSKRQWLLPLVVLGAVVLWAPSTDKVSATVRDATNSRSPHSANDRSSCR